MKRLFTFGCSYTSYAWPTWADLVSMDFEFSRNWGLSGIGNRAIAERVAEANVRYQFDEDDTIIVQWSSHLRNDWFHMHSLPERVAHWKTSGSVFNYLNEKLYGKKWIDTFFFEPAYFMHTLNHISLTQGLLKSTGCKWYMTSIGDIRNMGADLRTNTGIGEHTDLVKPHEVGIDNVAWTKIPELAIYDKPIWKDHAAHWLAPMELVAKQTPELTYHFVDTVLKNKSFVDTHPSVTQHQLWVKQELADKLQLSDETLAANAELAEAIEQLHRKFNFSKQTFELMLVKRTNFPVSASKMNWPFPMEGF